jgi:two-component system NarL family response regulator
VIVLEGTAAIHLAIISDQRVFGESLALALADDDVSVDAVVSHADQARLSIGTGVIIVDLDGISEPLEQAMPRLLRQAPGARVVVLSSRWSDQERRRAIGAGADAYAGKERGLADLRKTIASLARETAPPRRKNGTGERRTPADETLSPRECEVLRLLANGRSNREIAAELHVAEKTVKNHVSKILTKLDTTSRTHAVVRALRDGYL